MNGTRRVRFFPRAIRDLEDLDRRYSRQVLEDIERLARPPWPPAKVKKLRGLSLWEVKTGDYRSLFVIKRNDLIIVRVVNRRDLERAIGRIDVRVILAWLQEA